jgi:hypothetical protein
MTKITASPTLGIDLNPAFFTSPVVIGAGVTVSNPGYLYAVYRHSSATKFFVIDNNGAVSVSSPSFDAGIGIYLARQKRWRSPCAMRRGGAAGRS